MGVFVNPHLSLTIVGTRETDKQAKIKVYERGWTSDDLKIPSVGPLDLSKCK